MYEAKQRKEKVSRIVPNLKKKKKIRQHKNMVMCFPNAKNNYKIIQFEKGKNGRDVSEDKDLYIVLNGNIASDLKKYLRIFIKKLLKLIKNKKYVDAYKKILNANTNNIFSKAGVFVKTDFLTSTNLSNPYPTDEQIETVSNMFNRDMKRINIKLPDNDWFEDVSISNDKKELVLLKAVEEFMHAYQSVSNLFLSSLTWPFKSYEKNMKIDKEDMDYDEVDIYATLLEQGFDVSKFKDNYDIRIRFAKWNNDMIYGANE